ncbi:class I SAM-dependent methyltransferase [Arenimonas terrae]|uniref:Methyltransferase domain-containing protein n=1 Tax=Arenimonas terrae TaxID=2546226 RepID=A0A5C4RXR5_9GAMM|nr:methyltransferase domain-containing protein [Arenimonas terrae]TNJ35501.1 methyltransferase domain-containing protein [Arenimonas terrae]
MRPGRGLRDFLQPLLATPLHPQWLAHRLRRQRAHWLSARAAGRALDVGCADRAAGAGLPGLSHYVGLDYPGTAIALYRTRPDVFADAARLPFSDGSFDCVLMLDVLEHVAEPEAALAEAGRVLNEGGQLLLTIPFAYPLHDLPHDFQRFARPGLQRRIEAAGLMPAEIEEQGGGIEAAALNLCLALSRGFLVAAGRRPVRCLLLSPLLALVPVVNLAGWLFARLLPAPDFLPGAYFVRAVRR